MKTIVLPENPDRVLRFAARELQRYLKTMGGTTLPIRAPRKGETSITLATCDASDSMDEYRIDSRGNDVRIDGVNSRSVLYGVYDLLETLGCRFVEPGIEHVPRLKTVSVPRINRTETAAFALRNIFRTATVGRHDAEFHFLDPDLFLPQIDWMAKRRLNHHNFYIDYYRLDLWEKHKQPVLDAFLDRGIDLEVTFHSLHYFCPPDENHDFGKFGPSTYQRNHPNWYLPAYEIGSRGRWQTRVELPAVQKIVRDRYLDYVRRNPELKIVGIWPDDIPMNNPTPWLNPSDGYEKFWNRIADALASEFPDKFLGTIAYFELIKPPRKVMPRANEHCWFCPLERNFHYPLRHPRNRKFLPWLKRWAQCLAPQRLAVFDYYGWSVPFIPYREIMRDDLQAYHELRVGGLYGWSGFTANILGEDYRWALDMVALTHLLWDPRARLRPIEETWTGDVFGAAAGPVLDFHDFLKAAHRRESKRGLADYIFMGFAGDSRWIHLDSLHRAQRILSCARQRARGDERIRKRIDQLEQLAAHGATCQVRRR